MRYIGRVEWVQVQRESLKVDADGRQDYNPAPLLVVPALRLSAEGAHGVDEDGALIVDVHHVRHPRSRNRGDNFLSMGFTGHYATLRARFGDHLTDGVAGENVIVRADGVLTPAQLGGGLVIETQAGARVTLGAVLPIPPCEPFSRYAAGRVLSAPEMKATLQFLGDGMRGFYMRPAMSGAEAILIQAGDTVWVQG